MSLSGQGALLLWHQLEDEGRVGFYDWHGREHVPERLALPGFLRGRRFVTLGAERSYFNLYEIEGPAALSSPEYLAQNAFPSESTRAALARIRPPVTRWICRVAASSGHGQGGLVATFRFALDEGQDAEHRIQLLAKMDRLSREPGIAGCHLLISESPPEGRKVGSALVVESWDDEEPFRERCLALSEAGPAPIWALYRLQCALERS